MSGWVDDIDADHADCVDQGLDVAWPPARHGQSACDLRSLYGIRFIEPAGSGDDVAAV